MNLKSLTVKSSGSAFKIDLDRLNFCDTLELVDSQRLFNHFRKILDIKTANADKSSEVVELVMENFTVRRDFQTPGNVEIIHGAKITGDSFKKFCDRMEVSGIFDADFTLIEPKVVTKLAKMNAIEFRKFICDRVMLVEQFEAVKQDNLAQNYADYDDRVRMEARKEMNGVKVHEIEERLDVATQIQALEKEMRALKFITNTSLRKDVQAQIKDATENVTTITTNITEVDTEIAQLADNVYMADIELDTIEDAIQTYNETAIQLKHQTLCAVECLQPVMDAELLELNLDEAWRKFLNAANETSKLIAESHKISSEIESQQAKIHFFNLLQADWDEANAYYENLQETLRTFHTIDQNFTEQLNNAREDVRVSHFGALNSFSRWQEEVSAATEKLRELSMNFKEICTKIAKLTHEVARGRGKLAVEKATAKAKKSKSPLNDESLEGLVELEKFMANCTDERILAGYKRPLYKMVEFAEGRNPMVTEFASILPLILVKNRETALALLDNLPTGLEYTFLITNQFYPERDEVLKRSQHRNFISPISFLGAGVSKEISQSLAKLLPNIAVTADTLTFEQMYKLQEIVKYSLINQELDSVTATGVIRGGYCEDPKIIASDVRQYVEFRMKIDEQQQYLNDVSFQLETANVELIQVRNEIYYMVTDMYVPVRINLHAEWKNLLDTKLQAMKHRGIGNFRTKSTQDLIEYFEGFINDQENQEGITIEGLYEDKQAMEAKIKLINEKLSSQRITENQELDKFIKHLIDCKRIERSFDISQELPLNQICKTFHEDVVKAVKIVNESLCKSSDVMLDLCVEDEKQREKILEDLVAMKQEELHEHETRNNLVMQRKFFIELITTLETQLETFPATAKPLTNIQLFMEKYPNQNAAAQRLSEVSSALQDLPYPSKINVYNDKTLLTRYHRTTAVNQIVSSPFIDNISLVLGQLHERTLRQIYNIFNFLVGEVGLNAAMKFTWRVVNANLHIDDLEGIELCGGVEKTFLVVIALISIALTLRKPFIVLHDFLRYIPADMRHAFVTVLRKISNDIQIICIDHLFYSIIRD